MRCRPVWIPGGTRHRLRALPTSAPPSQRTSQCALMRRTHAIWSASTPGPRALWCGYRLSLRSRQLIQDMRLKICGMYNGAIAFDRGMRSGDMLIVGVLRGRAICDHLCNQSRQYTVLLAGSLHEEQEAVHSHMCRNQYSTTTVINQFTYKV